MKLLSIVGLVLAIAAALGGLSATIGYQLGWMSVGTSLLTVLTNAAYTGGLAAAVSLVALVALVVGRKKPAGAVWIALAGFVIGATVIAIPGRLRYESQRHQYPPIHDISTDTTDPPVFVDVLPLRKNARNPVEYGGPKIAVQQQRAYPDLQPVILSEPPPKAFDRALEAARKMGWDVVAANPEALRIEATDTTFWFRFKDDVVIRLRPAEGGTRLDVRSLSRVGGGDVGTNAKRIRAYLQELES